MYIRYNTYVYVLYCCTIQVSIVHSGEPSKWISADCRYTYPMYLGMYGEERDREGKATAERYQAGGLSIDDMYM